MGISLRDLVDISQVQAMAEALHQASGLPIGIVDVNGAILVGAGWQEICIEFHRADPQCRHRCLASDRFIAQRLPELSPGEHVEYKCLNGLWDIGIPIVVDGRHLATCFLGQFFYEGEQPDREFFRKQAREFGFDEADYLAALDRVPVFSREKVQSILEYDRRLVSLLTSVGLANLRQQERSAALEEANHALKLSESRFRGAFESSAHGMALVAPDGRLLQVNPALCRMVGYEEAELLALDFQSITHPDDLDADLAFVRQLLAGTLPSFQMEKRYLRREGGVVWGLLSVSLVRDGAGRPVHFVAQIQDISARRNAEAELLAAKRQLEMQVGCVNRIQSLFIEESHPNELFDALLLEILKLTGSSYGFIAETLEDEPGRPYLKTLAISNIAWDEATRAYCEVNAPSGLCFTRMHGLYAAPFHSRAPVIANDPAQDPRRCGLPPGHPPLRAFLGVPILRGEEVVGVVGGQPPGGVRCGPGRLSATGDLGQRAVDRRLPQPSPTPGGRGVAVGQRGVDAGHL
ncbi:MAG: PocR ligand-binding domain-containing protein [Magnetococcales bacterium]|nr:PocR ligand-binding domain-containing protein [Magnetococcales bacterium]